MRLWRWRNAAPSAPPDPLVPADDARRQVLPGLDSVRAWGAFLVLATHVAFWTGNYDFSLTGTLLSRLDVGVALFFVLSGFLLSRPYLTAARTGRARPGTRHYLWKRLLRIMPPYWIVAIPALTLLVGNAGAGPREWLQTLTLTDLYFADHMPAGLSQMWSLATELAFYLLLPLIMWVWNAFTRGSRSDLRVVVLVVFSAAIGAAWVLLMPQQWAVRAPMILQWLPSYLVWFFVGIGLAHAHEHQGAPAHEAGSQVLDRIRALGQQPGVCFVTAGALMLASATPIAGPAMLFPATPGQVVTKNLIYAVVAGLVVLPVAFGPRGVLRTVVEGRASRHLGHISYGVFCVHILVLHLITYLTGWGQFRGHGWEMLALTVLVSVVLAEGLYWFVERPLSRFRTLGRSATTATDSAASGASISH